MLFLIDWWGKLMPQKETGVKTHVLIWSPGVFPPGKTASYNVFSALLVCSNLHHDLLMRQLLKSFFLIHFNSVFA